ncbi:MAG: 50S ribosomal protein L25 [Bacteroidales bacterium]|nr:50S ribosomal protein L25 [Bacteroidales bacterium]
MQTFNLNAEVRSTTGKKCAKQLRKNESVPAVIYGGAENINLSISAKELTKAVCSPNVYIVEIAAGGKNYSTVIKEVQFHPVTDNIIHVDFLQLTDHDITVALPVSLNGQAEGVKLGGKLLQGARKLRVHGDPRKLPNVIDVDVTSLGMGKSIMVGDVDFKEFKVVEPKSMVIASVKATRAARSAEAEANKK